MAHHAAIRSEWKSAAASDWLTWQSGHVYAVGAYVVPPTPTGWYYKATAVSGTGTSGATPPAFPAGPNGATVVDNAGPNQITWTAMYTTAVLASELAAFDAAVSSGVNGVDGGTYAPSGATSIGGSGLVLTGPLKVARGGTLHCQNGIVSVDAPTSILLGAGHSGRSRTVMYPFLAARPDQFGLWRPRRDSSGMQALAPTYSLWKNPGVVQPAKLHLKIRGVQGATISQVTVGFRVVAPHTNVPPTMPMARLLRIDLSGNAVPCTSVASGADANGWVPFTKPASAAAWVNFGQGQTFVLPVDQNNVVDITQYHYVLQVQDEQGLTGWPWQVSVLQPCKLCSFGGQSSPPSGSDAEQLQGATGYDGVTANAGDRILVINTFGQQETGVYVHGASGLARAQDLQQAAQWSQGVVVGVQQGQKFGGTWWQSSASIAAWTPGSAPLWTAGVGIQFWGPGASYSSTNYVVLPLTPTGYWYQVTAPGTTGTSEPAWATQVGATFTDNGVTYKCMGAISTPLPWVTRPDSDGEVQGLAMSHYGTIFESAAVLYTGITSQGWQ